MTSPSALSITALGLAGFFACASPATGQASRAWGRVSFFTNGARVAPEVGEAVSFGEYITSLTYRSAEGDETALDFAVDGRVAAYSTEGRDARVSLYEAWVGATLLSGALRVRAGNMWLNDLGGLGAVGGGMIEYRQRLGSGRLRVAGFGGLEPTSYEAGYVADVRRFGGLVAFDGAGARRHVAGYVRVRDAGLTERSVLTMTHYVPLASRVFVYQALEYDLQGPAGQGSGKLSYFFVNAHGSPTKYLDLQGTYHRGRSIDARTITLDQLNGRPISSKSLEGYLFESAGGRVTLSIPAGVRVYAGYARDRNNLDSDKTGRLTLGASATGVFGAGVDATASLSRIDRGERGSYDSWYASLGRSFGGRIYLSADYSSSLSVLRFTQGGGLVVETRPRTRRVGLSSIITLGRAFSLLVNGERTEDDAAVEQRMLAGITYRLP